MTSDSPERQLLQSVVEKLDPEVYQLHGEPWSDAWGSSQWVILTEADGKKRFMQIQIIRHT